MTFYDGKMFPPEYSGDGFAAEHGSWNHSQGSGREVIRIPIEKGRATGVYQDFLTGFTTDRNAWGRPVGVVVAADGSLLVSDDGARAIWRVKLYPGKSRITRGLGRMWRMASALPLSDRVHEEGRNLPSMRFRVIEHRGVPSYS